MGTCLEKYPRLDKIRTQTNSRTRIHLILEQFTNDTLSLSQVKKKKSFSQESVLQLRKKNKCFRYNRIQMPKVQNLEAKHTNPIGVFRIQETTQIEHGR